MAKPRMPKKTNGVAAAKQAEVAPAEVTPIHIAAAAETMPAETKRPTSKPASKPEASPTPVLTKAAKTNGNGDGQISSKLVPINVEDEIRQLAYLLSERRGFTPGHENEDWLVAEREVFQRYNQHQHSA